MVFSILPANTESAAYEIDNSLRFGGGDNHHLSLVFGSAASDANRRTWTFSGWVKLGQAAHYSQYYANDKYLLTSTDARTSTTNIGYGGYTSGNAGGFHLQDGKSGTYIETTTKFRDPSAWYHLVVKYDSTQSTASDRIFIYVNGESQPLNYSNSGDPEVDLNTVTDWFGAGTNVDATAHGGVSGNFIHNVNSYFNSGYDDVNNSFDGHAADWYLLDGQALAPTEFGETNDNGVWVPKKYTGTFNAHSFHLEFKQTGSSANSSGIGADTSGQDNHFKVGVNSTLAAVDVTTDTPTNNFMTMNPLFTNSRGTFAEGNLKVTTNVQGSVPYGQVEFGTFAVNKGKWYYEAKVTSVGSGGSLGLGWNERAEFGNFTNGHNNGGSAGNVRYNSGGVLTIGSSHSQATGVDSFTDGDIIGFALDLDNNKVYAYKNGNPQDDPTPDPDDNDGRAIVSAYNNYWTPWMSKDDTSNNATVEFNFGNPTFSISSGNADANGYGNFEYAVPSGYYALCTKNLAEYG